MLLSTLTLDASPDVILEIGEATFHANAMITLVPIRYKKYISLINDVMKYTLHYMIIERLLMCY